MVYQLFWGLYALDSNPSDTSGTDYASSIQIVKEVEESGTYPIKVKAYRGFL